MVVGRLRARTALVVTAFVLGVLLLFSAAARADAPANDDFADATALAAHPGFVNGSNLGATKEAEEPDHAGNPGGHSVWFAWTPESTTSVGIKGAGCFSNKIIPLIAVYTGPSLGSLTPVASNASPFIPNCFSETPQAEFEALAGTTYWIAVDGRDGEEGNFELEFSGPPANDDFADAAVIPAEPQSAFSTTRLATKEAGEPDHAGNPGGHSVWYSWTPAASGPMRIYTCSSFTNTDTVLAVYTGAELGDLTEVAGNDEAAGPLATFPGCAAANSEVVIDAVAGTTYRIAIDGADGRVGRFNLNFQGRPANDDFAAAQALTAGPFTLGYAEASTLFATKQAGEPNHAGNPGGHSVWFSWTAPKSGSTRISTCGVEGEMDTLLAVYTGSELATASLVAQNDNGPRPRCGGLDSELDLNAVAGTSYRIAVDGKNGLEHKFALEIDGPSANDDFAQAQALPGSPNVSVSGSNALADKEPGEPNHAGKPGGSSVWFAWTAPETGPFVISTCPYFENSPDTLLAVYTGSSLSGLTPVAAGDDSPSACQEVGSEATIEAVAGTTYRIAVDSKGEGGIFSIDIKGKPANDDFSSAQALGSGSAMAGGSTRFADKEPGEPNHAGNPGGHSLWFSWTPSKSGPVDLYACGQRPGVDTLLAVYTGSAVSGLTPVASNDDVAAVPQNEGCQVADGNSETVFNAAAGTTYRIAVDTKDSEGLFTLGLEVAPANDDFAAAQDMYEWMPTSISGITKLASKQTGEPDHAGAAGGHSLWFSWKARSDGPVSVQTCTRSGAFDTVLGVYTGSSFGGLTPVVSADDGQSRKGCRATDSAAEFDAEAGTTYKIAVDGKTGVGGFQLILEGAAANDDFSDALTLGGQLPVDWELQSNRFATGQAGEPEHAGEAGGSSVWFKWTAPRSGTVNIDTCESDFDTLLAVYTGATLAGLTPVQSNDEGPGNCAPGSSLSFGAIASTTYRIAADGKGGAQGTFELHIEQQPANDDFEDATVIPGRPGWYWPGSTLLATKQTGEPDHQGDAGGHSVWFSWTPAKSWEIELDICSARLQPLVGVYTGSALTGLTPVATSDEGSGECVEGGRSVGFTTVPGTTYHFAIDGAGGDAGHFLLHLRAPHLLPNTLSVATAGDGSGSVKSSLAGIDCTASCSHDFEEGAALVLTATPVAGSTFAGWSGGGCSGTAPCQLALDADTSVTAVFEQASEGGGTGGGDGGSAGGSPTPPVTSPAPTPPARKPLRCKRGFKKKRVHGKARCVRKHKPKPHKKHRLHR
ncbi:MAG: InlB B-repeat-containing protein [Solirubrobacterales bacterium]